MNLRLVPVNWGDSCAFVDMWHRHHEPPRGHKFCIGVANDRDILVGVAMVGRPVSFVYDDGLTLEVNRTATDGTPNANSKLYAAAWQAAKAMGYRRLITYTREGESGASLRAAGYRIIAQRPPRKGWDSPSRSREARYPCGCPKLTDGIARTLWEAAS